MMREEPRYVPVLKGKAGEYGALGELPTEVKTAITPVIEIVPPPKNQAGVSKPVTEYLDSEAERIADRWGHKPVFVDACHLSHCAVREGEPYPLVRLCDCARERGLHVIPVAATGAPNAILHAAARAHRIDQHGVCLRERPEKILAVGFTDELNRALDDLDVGPAGVDLIVDLAYLSQEPTLMARYAASAIERLPHRNSWRSLTLTTSSFPMSLSHLPPGIHQLVRSEWILWKELRHLLQSGDRLPRFGDYAVVHPELRDGGGLGSATIRYTTDQEYVIVRRRSLRKHGFGEYTRAARDLVHQEAFAAGTSSWGDAFVRECAKGTSKTGSQTSWIKAGVNHHLTFVALQLARSMASSGEEGPGSLPSA